MVINSKSMQMFLQQAIEQNNKKLFIEDGRVTGWRHRLKDIDENGVFHEEDLNLAMKTDSEPKIFIPKNDYMEIVGSDKAEIEAFKADCENLRKLRNIYIFKNTKCIRII